MKLDLKSESKPDLAILLLTYNRYMYTKFCFDSISMYTDFSIVKQFIIVDCFSTDGTQDLIKKYDFVTKIIKSNPGCVSRSMYKGIKRCSSTYIIKIDNDILVSENWNRIIYENFKQAEKKAIKVMGYDTGEVKIVGSKIPLLNNYYGLPVSSVGGLFITRTKIFDTYEGTKKSFSYKTKDKYRGWAEWQRVVAKGSTIVLYPRTSCFVIPRIVNIPSQFIYLENRLNEPIVKDLIKNDPLKLMTIYIKNGWMRKDVYLLKGNTEMSRRKQVNKNISDIFKYDTYLYIGAKRSRFQLRPPNDKSTTVLEIFPKNIEDLKEDYPYMEIIQGDVRNISFILKNRKFDVSIWWHGPEHVEIDKIHKILEFIESITNEIVVLACPWGKYIQGPVKGNIYEEHLCYLHPEFFNKLGYSTHVIGKENRKGNNLLSWKYMKGK